MRLIDGDALMNTLQKLFDKREKEKMFTGSRGSCVTWNDAIYHIKSAPTVDAVPVVRCRECKHNYGINEPMCDFADRKLRETDFCSRGERKGGDE